MNKNTVSTRPKLTLETAGLSLNVPQPVQTGMDIARKDDVFPGLFMNVSVYEIDFFDKNPRTQHDPELYRQIKESIRESGVQQPVHITRRPDSSRFVLAQGGNTRLKICQELHEETGLERFAVIPAIFAEYTSEADIQIAHLIENEQRAEMCFWDKAQAYAAIREMFREQHGKQLSLRELESLFLTHGLSISYSVLALFFYAADNLNGLGHCRIHLSNPKTLDIRKLANELEGSLKTVGQQDRFLGFWDSTLQEWTEQQTEADGLDTASLGKYLQQRFAEAFGGILPEQPQQTAKNRSATAPRQTQATATDASDNAAQQQGTDKILSEKGTGGTTDSASIASHGNYDGTVTPPVDPAAERQHGQGTAAEPFSPPENRDEALRRLHRSVRKMLSLVHLDNCFRSHDAFRYGFYIEYPNFHNIPKTRPDALFVIDNLHEDAGDVFAYLAKVSMQESLLAKPDLGSSNPLLMLPESSPLRTAYQDPDVLDEYNVMGIGERVYLLDRVLYWQTTDTPYTEPVSEILNALRAVHRCEKQENDHE